MKRTLLSLVAIATASGGMIATAHAQGWYIGTGLGENLPATISYQASNGKSGSIKTSAGYSLVTGAGYKFGALRIEGELGSRNNSVNGFTGNGPNTTGGGKLIGSDYMANIIYDIPMAGPVTPYLGAGFGMGEVAASKVTSAAVGSNPVLNGGKWGGTWQGIAGVSYAVIPGLAVTASYRYVSWGTLDMTITPAAGGGVARVKPYANTLLLGFSAQF